MCVGDEAHAAGFASSSVAVEKEAWSPRTSLACVSCAILALPQSMNAGVIAAQVRSQSEQT